MTPKGRGGRRTARLTVDAVIAYTLYATVIGALALVAGLFIAAAYLHFTRPDGPDPVAAARHVEELRSQIRLDADGTVHVTEHLTYDFAADGSPAVRRLPHTGTIASSPVRDLGLEDVRVTDDGGAGPVDITRGEEWVEVTIGDPDHPITGTRTFTLEYTYRNLLIPGAQGRPRLFFDVVGTDWSILVRNTTAEVTLPARPRDVFCYAGPRGSHDPCTSIRERGDTVEFTQEWVPPMHAMSVDIALSPGDVPAPEPYPETEEAGGGPSAGAWITLAILVGLGVLVFRSEGSSGGGGGGGGGGGDSSGGAGDGGGGGGGD
ncbi:MULTISPECIES: DUF2207 domain-containing protein [unclassified Nocardiopsis]|uniref:DUF2207 domain-containing protein n=1 Tax=Nocardiopsis TaxID=2013 RepID=UPI00387B1AB5